jgi:CheY-like chemotaxis protein/CRP-like cAMP-binding protein
MAQEAKSDFIKSLRKIPIFKDLSPTQARQLLSICKLKEFAAGDIVCSRNSPSEQMFILISGELAVMSEDGAVLADLHPVTTVGEMGLITRQNRSAQVAASTPSKAMVMERRPFNALLSNDPGMKLKVYHSVVEVLAKKIINDNVRTRDHLLLRVQSEEKVAEYRKKLDCAVNLLVEKAQMSPDEAREKINEDFEKTSLSVLIVDDEEMIRKFVKSALMDYNILEASNGEEAMAVVEDVEPDLVITDIRMPRMDGYELADRLREKYPELPVMALSGVVSREQIEGHSFVDFVDKPMRLEDFREAIELALGKKEEI